MSAIRRRAAASWAGKAIIWTFVIPLAHLSLMFLCYGVWIAAGWTGAIAALLALGSRMRRQWRILASFILLLLLPIAALLSVRQTNERTRHLWALVKGKQLRFADRVAIYAHGMIVPYGAILYGAPEVALEHVLLYLPGDDKRVLHSAFAAKHHTVERILNRFVDTLDRNAPRGSRQVLRPMRVAFPYPGGVPDRVSLALNAPDARLSAIAEMTPDGWNVEAQISAGISYPPQSRLKMVLLKGLAIELEEGLLHALQEARWLHPYEVIWKWRFKVPRSS